MTREEVAEIIAETLDSPLAAKPGAVLYSSPGTIASGGRFYLMGLNPGGDPASVTTSIAAAFAPADGTSAYTHQCWMPGCNEATCTHLADGRVRPKFLVRHQRNVAMLAKELGHDTPATLPSANAIFARSTSLAKLLQQTGYTPAYWWKACWPVHQRFLARIRPEVIVTLGYGERTSAFGFLRQVADRPEMSRLGDEDPRGGWTFRWHIAALKLDVLVIGVPHPSYYPIGKRLADELRKIAGTHSWAGSPA